MKRATFFRQENLSEGLAGLENLILPFESLVPRIDYGHLLISINTKASIKIKQLHPKNEHLWQDQPLRPEFAQNLIFKVIIYIIHQNQRLFPW